MAYGSKTNSSGEVVKADSQFTPITAGEKNPGFKFISFVMVEETNRASLTFEKGGKEFKQTIFYSDQEWAQEAASRTILHIATKMGSDEDYYNAIGDTGDTLEDFINWVAKANKYLTKASKDKTFTLKIVYNNRGYLSFPKFPNFIELDGTNPSTLSTNEKYDNYIKPQGTESPAETRTATVEDDLPF